MISRAGNENFIVRHYDWFVAGAGVAALLGAGVFFALSSILLILSVMVSSP